MHFFTPGVSQETDMGGAGAEACGEGGSLSTAVPAPSTERSLAPWVLPSQGQLCAPPQQTFVDHSQVWDSHSIPKAQITQGYFRVRSEKSQQLPPLLTILHVGSFLWEQRGGRRVTFYVPLGSRSTMI